MSLYFQEPTNIYLKYIYNDLIYIQLFNFRIQYTVTIYITLFILNCNIK